MHEIIFAFPEMKIFCSHVVSLVIQTARVSTKSSVCRTEEGEEPESRIKDCHDFADIYRVTLCGVRSKDTNNDFCNIVLLFGPTQLKQWKTDCRQN